MKLWCLENFKNFKILAIFIFIVLSTLVYLKIRVLENENRTWIGPGIPKPNGSQEELQFYPKNSKLGNKEQK